MDINKLDLIKILHYLKYKMDDQSRIYIDYDAEQLEKKLRSGNIYSDEIVLLNILRERVNSKMSVINARITRNQNRKNYGKPFKENHFKDIDVNKLRRFIASNEFQQPDRMWITLEDSIADKFFDLYMKNR